MRLTDRAREVLDAAWLRWLLLAGLLVLYAGWIGYVIVADRPLDFYVYYMAAEAAARGESPYTISDEAWDALASDLRITNYTRPYRYPPYTAAMLTLFRPLGARRTMVIWVVANGAAMIGGAWLLGLALGGGRWLRLSLIGLGLFAAPLATLLAGQINGLLFLCLALAIWAAAKRRAGWLGASLALGTVLKVIPLALVLYLFWRRQWRAGLIAIGVLVALTIAAALVVGTSDFALYVQKAIFLANPDGIHRGSVNQTITAVLGRAFPDASSAVLTASRWLALGLIAVTAALCWPAGGTSKLMSLEIGLIVAALQIIPPFTWYHQLVLLLIPLLVAARWLWDGRRWPWLALLVGLFILTTLHGLTWHYLVDLPWLTSFPFVLGLVLWMILGWAVASGKWRRAAI